MTDAGAAGAVMAVAGGAVGAVVPDLDVSASKARRAARRARLVALAVVAGAVVADQLLGLGLAGRIESFDPPRALTAAAALVVFWSLGAHTPHRSFMHSLICLGLSYALLEVALPGVAPWFAVGHASHVALDLLNHTPVRVLWPLGGGVALGLCSSSGAVNKALGWVCTAASVGMIVYMVFASLRGYVPAGWSF